MMSKAKHETREVFTATLALNTPEERARYLEEACRGKPEMRERVEVLLRAHDQSSGFLEQTVEVPPTSDFLVEHAGVRIGRYKLLQEVGQGGFGRVFLAEQIAPVRRRVALKIVKAGMDTREVIVRFEAERQALALMDHPNIARVLDAGATEAGRPYFVMELVQGIPITEYCDRNHLPMAERLQLFMQVCHAVQHAHQKAIIHRDLKPTNILVTMIDGQPVPKVIDFGVAKALGQELTEKTLFTAFDQIIGTPAYMSPEQAALSAVDVDTRSDIYALGVLLYELLTGVTPFDAETLRNVALDEVRRMIRETEPPKPSTRLRTLGDKLTEVAQHRQTEPSALPGLVHGDLDWIVMKALEKDRTRRYETAGALAADLQRHLQHEPVLASPPSTTYRARKYVRRHCMGVALAASVTLALVAGLAAALIGFTQARWERDRAETNYLTAREAVDRMFSRLATDLAGWPRMMQIRRSLLEDALEFHQRFLEQKRHDPELRHTVAGTYMRMGGIYQDLGQHGKSVEAFGQALALLELLAQQHPSEAQYRKEMVRAHNEMAYADMWLDRANDGIAHKRQALVLCETLQRLFPDVPEYWAPVVGAHVGMGNQFGQFDRLQESLVEMQQALRLYEEFRSRFPNLPKDPVLLAHVRHWLGAALSRVGRLEEAEEQYRQARSLRIQYVAEHSKSGLRSEWAHVNFYLANLLTWTGRPSEAESLLQEAVALDDQLLDDHPDNAGLARRAGNHYRALGRLLGHMRRAVEAEAALRRAVAIHTKVLPNAPNEPIYPESLAWSVYDLGQLLHATGRPEEAAEAFGKAIGLLDRIVAEYPDRPGHHRYLGMMLVNCPDPQLRDPVRALALAKKALELRPESQRFWNFLGIAEYRAGDPSAAIEALEKSLELQGYDEPETCLYLAMAHWQKGERDQARQRHDKAMAWIKKYQPAEDELLRLHTEAQALVGKAPARLTPTP